MGIIKMPILYPGMLLGIFLMPQPRLIDVLLHASLLSIVTVKRFGNKNSDNIRISTQTVYKISVHIGYIGIV